jgi:hypothetical protein
LSILQWRFVGTKTKFSAEIAAEFPVSIENPALQVVSDYRLRGGIHFTFEGENPEPTQFVPFLSFAL